MILRRVPNWSSRLNEHVEAFRDLPFAWGTNDCVTFAATAVECVTGHRPAMPTWSNAREAARLLSARNGLEVCIENLELFIRLDRIRQARRGDIVLVPQAAGPAVAVCLGHCWVAPGLQRLTFGSLSEATAAWKVG